MMTAKKREHDAFLIYAALALITFAVFWGVHRYEFVNLDDPEYITGNQNIQQGFTAEAIKWAFTSGYAANWHPVTWLSHMMDCRLFGLNAGAHHALNLLIHVVNVLLLFYVLKKTTGAIWKSAFVSCLFAIHPLHVESVAWVSERKDVLSTMFWMLTTIAYVRYCRRPSVRRYAPVLVLFGIGLMAKPMLVTLPFVLLLMDYWPLGRLLQTAENAAPKSKAPAGSCPGYKIYFLIAEKIPLLALTAVSSVITFVVQREGGAMSIRDYYSLGSRIGNAFESYVVYIYKTLWPASLAPFYPHPAANISIVYSALAAAVLLAITFFVIRFGRTHRYLPVGWFWYIGVLVPVIGLVQVGEQAYADRYSYVAIIGLFVMVAWGVPQIFAKWPSKNTVLAVSSVGVIALLSIVAHNQQQYWRSSIPLFEHAIEVTQNNHHAHFCIAEPLRKEGRLQEAIYHNAECLKIRPDHTEALNSMGLAMMDAGRVDEAIQCFEKAIKLKPNLSASYINLGFALTEKGRYDEAISIYRTILPRFDEPTVHVNLATALKGKGNKEEAIKEYERFLKFEPSNASAHYSVGVLLAEQGRGDEAADHFRQTLQIMPDSVEAHNSLGYVLAQKGKYDEAIQHYNEALKLAPLAAEIHINLGYVFVVQENFDSAAAEYRKALAIQPDNYVAHTYLGAVLFRLGRTKEAIEEYSLALQLNPEYAKAKNDLQAIKSLMR